MNALPFTIYLSFLGAALALVAGARSAAAARLVALVSALAGFGVALVAGRFVRRGRVAGMERGRVRAATEAGS